MVLADCIDAQRIFMRHQMLNINYNINKKYDGCLHMICLIIEELLTYTARIDRTADLICPVDLMSLAYLK